MRGRGDHLYHLSPNHFFDYPRCFRRRLAGLARDEHHLLDLDFVLEFVLFGHGFDGFWGGGAGCRGARRGGGVEAALRYTGHVSVGLLQGWGLTAAASVSMNRNGWFWVGVWCWPC